MKNKKQLIVLVLIAVGLFFYFQFGKEQNDATESKLEPEVINASLGNAITSLSFLPTSTTGAIVNHNYFVLSYAEDFEQAE